MKRGSNSRLIIWPSRLLVLLVLVGLTGLVMYLLFREGAMPVNKSDTSRKVFVIKKGEDANEVAKKLYAQGLIRSKLAFFIAIRQLGIEKNIQAGDFRLSPSMNLYEILKELQHGRVDTWITVVEGLRKEEVAEVVSAELGIDKNEFINKASEGRLFPETYLIPVGSDAAKVVEIMQNTFDQKYTKLKAEIPNKNNLTDRETLILASLVEREARKDIDRKKVANIILKRVRNNWPLEVDATTQYAIGYDERSKSWWKTYLTSDDLNNNSPYNTRKFSGLPPGPICSPGLSSLQAVLEATGETPYWYYISDKSGQNMYYAQTLEEHEENIANYLN